MMTLYIDLNHLSRSTYAYVINFINLNEQAVQKGLLLAKKSRKARRNSIMQGRQALIS